MADTPSGKPSGWTGPIGAYTRNAGSVGRKRIVFVGASYKFVHKVVRDMMLVGGFDDCQLVLHDIDDVPLKMVGDLLERMIAVQKRNITVVRTLDRAAALKDADAVVLCITIGGKEADCRSFEACARYGIPVGIGDTMGPTALARNLRTVPFVVQLVREMEKLAPKAALLNFTNPMSALTCAAARHTAAPVYGLCHSADELTNYFAGLFGCAKSAVELDVGGVNHQSFVVRLAIQGVDRTRDILATAEKSTLQIADTLMGSVHSTKLQQDMCRVLGAWPSTGEDHLAEFYPFFYTARRRDSLGFHAIQRIQPGRQPYGRTACPQIIQDWAYGPDGPGDLHLITEEHAHELLWSLFSGEPFTRVLNVLNRDGLIRDVARDACVEARVTTAGHTITGRPLTLPPAVLALVQRWTAVHDLSIRAALGCDCEAARQALLLDPHVTDLYDIEPLLESLLLAMREHLPAGWKLA